MERKIEWENMGANEVLEGGDFYISFNPSVIAIMEMWKADTSLGETALVKPDSKIKYRILNGDFRKQYEKVIHKGFKACLKVYNQYKEKHNSSWTGK